MDTTEIDFNRVNSLSAEGPVELNGQKTVHELLSYQQNKVEVSCKFSTLGAYYEKNRNNMINSATQSSNANSSRNRKVAIIAVIVICFQLYKWKFQSK